MFFSFISPVNFVKHTGNAVVIQWKYVKIIRIFLFKARDLTHHVQLCVDACLDYVDQ